MNVVINDQYNIGYICTKQQCDSGKADKIALRWVSPNQVQDYTYANLETSSNKIANALLNLGVNKGDRVVIFIPKSPELYFIFLGTIKIQAIACILFSAFGEEALLDRLKDSQAKILFTNKYLLHKIKAIWPNLPDLKKIIVVDADSNESDRILAYSGLVSQSSDAYQVPQTPPDVPSVLHYTSGSTGKPKGVLHVHRSVLSQTATFKNIFGIVDDDIYWCTADPGWVTGVSYGMIGPFSHGITQVNYGGKYDPEVWFTILQDEKVTVWYTAPTALRMLMQNSDVD